MSFGKRRPKPSRAQLRPSNPIAIQQGRLARQRDRLARLARRRRRRPRHRRHRPRLRAPRSPSDSASGPAARSGSTSTEFRGCNQKKTNAERQMVVDQVATSMINDPAPIRDLAERLDDLTVAIAKAARLDALPEALRTQLEARPGDLRRAQGGHRHARAARRPARQIDAAFAPLDPRRRARPRHAAAATRSRAATFRSARSARSRARPISSPASGSSPNGSHKPDGPVSQEFIAALAARGSARPLPAGRRSARRLPDADLRRADDHRSNASRPATASRTSTTPTATATSSSSRTRRSTRNSSSCSGWSTRRPTPALGLGARLRRGASILVLVAALFALIGYYIQRHEPEIARDLRRIAALCALVVAAPRPGPARWRIQPWDAELIPVAIAAMILAIAYNPHFALMVTFALCLLTCLALGTGIGHFLVLMGGTAAGVLTLNEVRTRTKLIKVGAAAALGYFVLTWATGLWQSQPIEPDRQRQPLACRLGPDGRLLPRRQPAVRRELVRHRHGDQPARAGRHHPSAAPGVGPPGPGHAQPLDHRRHDRRGGRRADRRRCLAGAHRGLLPRHRQDAQAALLRREPGGGGQPARQPRAGDEHADHHRPRQGRRRPGPAAPPARADHRPDRAAPRHDPGRVLLSRGQPAERRQPRRGAGPGKRIPLSRARSPRPRRPAS